MAQLIKGNYNALTWLQAELQQSLAQALNAVNRYIDAPSEHKALSDCIESIYQVKGTLEMLNLSGSSLLAEEMQKTAVAIRDKKNKLAENSDAAQEALVRALLLLPNYLKLINESFEDHPLSLLDNINELRSLRGDNELSEISLFKPALKIPLPDNIAPSPTRAAPKLSMDKRKLSHAFQLLLLNWLKTQDVQSINKMQSIMHFMRLSCQEEKTTLLWWAAETLLEALAHDGLAASPDIKQSLGKLVVPLKLQTENQEADLLLAYPSDLLTTLLLNIAKASTQSANVSLFKQTFGLDFFDHKTKIYGMSDNALGNANEALLEQLQDLKEQVSQFDRDQNNAMPIITAVAQQLRTMGDTLAFLEEYESSNLLHHQHELLENVLSSQQTPSEQVFTELADTLLKVEHFLQTSTAKTIDAELLNSVMGECLLEMANIKESLTLMSQRQQLPASELTEIASQLRLIAGSLTMLNYPEAALILTDTASKIELYADNDQTFNSAQLDALADILASCDLFMEGIRQHGQTQTNLLHDASEILANFDNIEESIAEITTPSEVATNSLAIPPQDELDDALAAITEDDVSVKEELALSDTVTLDEPAPIESTSPSEITSVEMVQPVLPSSEERRFADGIDEEIAEIFLEEADEVMAEMKDLFPLWTQQADQNALSEIRRHFHTLKGSGRMAGATVLGELAWAVEHVLNYVIEGTRPDSHQVKQLALRSFEYMPQLLDRFAHADMDSDTTVAELMRLSESCLNPGAVTGSQPEPDSTPESEGLEIEQPVSSLELETTEQELPLAETNSDNNTVTSQNHAVASEDLSEPEADSSLDLDLSEAEAEFEAFLSDDKASLELEPADSVAEISSNAPEDEAPLDLELSETEADVSTEEASQELEQPETEAQIDTYGSEDNISLDLELELSEPEIEVKADSPNDETAVDLDLSETEAEFEAFLSEDEAPLEQEPAEPVAEVSANASEDEAPLELELSETEIEVEADIPETESAFDLDLSEPELEVEADIPETESAFDLDLSETETEFETFLSEGVAPKQADLTHTDSASTNDSTSTDLALSDVEQVDIDSSTANQSMPRDSLDIPSLDEDDSLELIVTDEIPVDEQASVTEEIPGLSNDSAQVNVHENEFTDERIALDIPELGDAETDNSLLILSDENESSAEIIDTEKVKTVEPTAQKPLTNVERYIREHNRALTSVELYIQALQQPVTETAPESSEEVVSEPVVTKPLTNVERYIREHNRALTSVELYIQALQQPVPSQETADSVEEDLALSEDEELHEIFKNEAQEHIAALQHALTEMKASRRIEKSTLRSIHSLKGCANIAQVTPMALIATELDQALRRLHAQDTTLDDEQLDMLSQLVDGLAQILLSLDGLIDEPDIQHLAILVDKLKPAQLEDANTVVIDPELLVVFLQETDELLDQYTRQLELWQLHAEDADNSQALLQTLSDLHEGALHTEQKGIASIYAALSELITAAAPDAEGLKPLLEQGYEQLNHLIEKLLQNKPAEEESGYAEQVQQYLTQLSQPSENALPLSPDLIDESDFQLPADVDPELLFAFTEEAQELLISSGQAIKDWQANGDNQAAQQLQRDLHTIKGGARLTGITPMADLTHQIETLVTSVNENRHPADEDFFDLLLRCQDKLTEMQEQLAAQSAVTTAISLIAEIGMLTGDKPVMPSAKVETTDHHYYLDEADIAIPEDIDPELLEAFTEEAAELLISSGNAIKQWQNDIQVTEAAHQLQRDLHTLKGGARLAGITPIADLTHHLETLVTAVQEDRYPADDEFFDLLHRCQDKLTEMQEQLAAQSAVTTAISLIAEIGYVTGNEELIQSSQAESEATVEAIPAAEVVPEKAVAHNHVEQVRVRADLLDYLTNFAGEVSISRDRVTQQHIAMQQQLREMEETVTRLRDQLRKLEIETETQILFRYDDEQLHQNQEFDPLELDRFSMIQQLSRSLSESVTDLIDISQSMDILAKDTDALLLQQSRLNTDLQHGLMNTRLLPFTAIIPRLERIVRQTSSELNKKAELSISGAELELDRTILDRLVAPIEHILRNAIAHGLESAEQRSSSGKRESGQLALKILREGSEMLLTIQDDGQGINVEKVKQKALSLGLIEESNIPGDDELVQLILTSGFSTADSVSQVAGRGVGMDVVSNEIRELKGRLTIQSKPGEGTRFSIRIPLTLSVIQGLLVTVHDEQYVVPLGSVNAGERISVEQIKSLLSNNHPNYQFNGEDYNFIPLATLLDKPISLPDNDKYQMPILLFKSGGMRLAILVDAVNSNREIVIKPVGKQLGNITAINGATILGDGRVVFILDIPTLMDAGDQDLSLDTNDALNLERELEQIHDRAPIAMVVDDSITMRKASGNLLKRLGFDVMTARDGIDALSQLHNQKPDIILLDVEMPRMDGFEFASIVRNDVNFRHLPIIMITSRTGEKHRERAMSIGVNSYLGKPYQEDDLVENMKKLLGNRFFQEQL